MAHTPGERFEYADLGFILPGELAQRATGRSLPDAAADRVFAPLGMERSGFLPVAGLDVAATEVTDGVARCGTVHDDNAAAMGGVAGHAGLFVTLADTARCAAQWSAAVSDPLPAPGMELQQEISPVHFRGVARHPLTTAV